MTDWFRSWHGAPADPKWRTIAKRAKVPTSLVVSVAWSLLDRASQADERGSIIGADIESLADFLDAEPSDVEAVIKAMHEKGVLDDQRFAAWEKRQPKREDTGSTDRVRQFRERQKAGVSSVSQRSETPMKRSETQRNDTKRFETTDTESETEKKRSESNNQQQHSTTPREPAAAAASSALPTIDTNQFEVLEQKLRAAAGYEQAPYPNLFNVGPILKLTQDGFDLETDILPIIRAKAKTASRPVQSWAFFVPAILEAKQASGKFNGGPFPVAQSAKSKQEQRAEMFAHHRANAKADGFDPDTELGLRKLLMAIARGEWKATWGSDPIGKNGRTERSDILIPAEWLASHLAVLENCAALLWKGGCYNDVEQLARFMGTKAIPAKTADELPNPEMARLCDEYLKIDPLEPPRLSPTTKPSLMPAIPSTFAQDGVSHLK
ncbi:hypothetical protein KL86PLE_100295 [uncultured Pleomorphomonas sp.]|uniref:DUF1376 domain-containing protein n=1 Tax=uncultured Pleomorphomonas sp. TaxID=442121 RepID=A0A212L2Q7_9HYPH|nr:hypothetical protein [uncultured Pleomorphomonas sp.]SCM71639.1 hypothetical protein KL86PLE_100295 [uncultured Pleomorphomonas sp.]